MELLPDPIDGTRYEIIDGELHVSTPTSVHHQEVCGNALFALMSWDTDGRVGRVLFAPGVIFSPDNDVAPDLIWISNARAVGAYDTAGHLRVAPELMVEVLSPGSTNEKRDKEFKLALYSRQGVHEYWILDWRRRRVQVFRRRNAALELAATLEGDDTLTSPLLPGFACPLSRLWYPLEPDSPA